MLKPKLSSQDTADFWETVSDEDLIDRSLTADTPSTLPGIVTTVPEGDDEPHVEFSYDFGGTENYQICVHGHRHLKGFVFRKGEARFQVGWMCGEAHYGQKFKEYTSDFEAARTRQTVLHRVRDLRQAVEALSGWAGEDGWVNAVAAFDDLNRNIKNRLPFVAETLRAYSNRKLYDVQMPRYLCTQDDPMHSGEAEFHRMLNEIATAATMLTGTNTKVAASIGSTVNSLHGVVRRAELLIAKLNDVVMFFQPAVLQAIADRAENSTPMRARHYPGLLRIKSRNQVVGMPESFSIPSRAPLDALIQYLNG
jgi:hypothetical protein